MLYPHLQFNKIKLSIATFIALQLIVKKLFQGYTTNLHLHPHSKGK